MYDFRDLSPHTGANVISWPAEAMVFNGKLFEREIPEYQTLQVQGRELVGQALDTLTVGNQDGERLRSRRYPARKITVKYQVDADTPERFREIFYQLNALLQGQNEKFYFLDDTTKYYQGTLSEIESVPGGSNSVVSSFTLYCSDPFKYAIEEDKFEFADKAETKTFSTNFAGKTYQDTTKVPHSIYYRYEPVTVAMAGPKTYVNELDQSNYSKLANRDDEVAGVSASSILTGKSVSNFKKTDDSSEDGALDSVELVGDTIKFRGWHATNSSKTMKNYWIIVNNPEWTVEYGRVKVELTDRPDVGQARPNIANSAKSGFEGAIPYTETMKNKKLRVFFRYADDDGNVDDWAAWLTTSETWRQSMPHMMIKFDVLQAMEQADPGFWTKYGKYGRAEQLVWLKDALNNVKFKAWAYGKGYSGNNLTMKFWNGTDSWDGTESHNTSAPTLFERDFGAPADFFKYVSIDGYVYINLYPEYNESSKETDSYVYLDYFQAELNIDLPTSNSLAVTNNGPFAVPIRFELTSHGDNGFIGIQGSKANETVLVGSPEQVDGGIVEKSERLFTLDQSANDLSKQFKFNIGTLGPNYHATQTGSFFVDWSDNGRWRARTTREGFGQGDGWHGPSIHRDYEADSTGVVGADNFTNRNYWWFSADLNQAGLQSVTLQGADGGHLVTVQMWSPVNGNSALKVMIGLGAVTVYEDVNPRWNSFKGEVKINRSGNTYTINVSDAEGTGHGIQTISYDDPESAQVKCTGWTHWKAMYADQPYGGMDLYDTWYQVDRVDHYVDIPNIFNDGDRIMIGGTDRRVDTYVNNVKSLTMQNVGSQPVMAYPGTNIINFSYSTFADRPDVIAYIRRKYL